MAGWFTTNAPPPPIGTPGYGSGGMGYEGGGFGTPTMPIQRPALPGGTATGDNALVTYPEQGRDIYHGGNIRAPSLNLPEPIKVGSGPNIPDPNNPNAQLAGGDPMRSPSGGQDPEAYFNSLFPGESLSPQELVAKENELKAAGIRILGPNAAGQRSKIQLPDGRVIDVIGGAGSGQNRKQFMSTGGGGGGNMGSLGNFQTGSFTGGGKYPLASVMGEGLAAPWTTPFNAPDPNSVTNDKALQWQMGRGMDAIQRSAAAKGTLLTGGTLKSIDAFGQGLGSTYYGDVYNRALGEYKMAHDIFSGNQDTLYNRLYGVSGMGLQAAGGLGNYGNAYGQNATNLETGMANSRSAGTVGVGNAIGNAVGGVANAIGQRPSNQSSYDPNKPAPPYGAEGYTPGMGAPFNSYQQTPLANYAIPGGATTYPNGSIYGSAGYLPQYPNG